MAGHFALHHQTHDGGAAALGQRGIDVAFSLTVCLGACFGQRISASGSRCRATRITGPLLLLLLLLLPLLPPAVIVITFTWQQRRACERSWLGASLTAGGLRWCLRWPGRRRGGQWAPWPPV